VYCEYLFLINSEASNSVGKATDLEGSLEKGNLESIEDWWALRCLLSHLLL